MRARLLAVALCLEAGLSAQALNQNCIVAVLNRTVQVSADGSWVLPNIPSGFGLVRARATCVNNGITSSGQSDLFNVVAFHMNGIPAITIGPTTAIPTSLTLTAPSTTLTQAGSTVQLVVKANFPGGTVQNVTTASTGTQYQVSNPAIATVDANGLVTAHRSGTAIIQAVNEGTQGLLTLQILLSVDSDGDGIPDDAEIAMGLNPNDPTDALLDADHDGLTNGAEYKLGTDIHKADTDGDGLTDGQEVLLYHTNPLVADTDGDGVPDGLEVQAGTDPLNPASRDLSKVISSLEVKPSTFLLDVTAVQGQASQQLTVLAHLTDGKTVIDVTSTQTGTNYASSDLTICNFGTPDGNVFAGSAGSCTVTVTNAGFTASANGTVTGFSPKPLSFISIPGFANAVAVSGNVAYIAAGAAGLQVVDVTNRSAPAIIGSLALPGNADDVKVVGNIAYIAAGSAGLHAVDVSNPRAPSLLGTLDTGPFPSALNVAVQGGIAYIANGNLLIADVSNPAAMTKISSLSVANSGAQGVAVQGNLAVVAAGVTGIWVVDVSNRAAPVLRGRANTGDPTAVAISGNIGYVADYDTSTNAVDISNPSAPVVLSHVSDLSVGGKLQDIVLSGNFALAADIVFVNGVPITDISVPNNLQARAILRFPQRDDNGMGIAADGEFVYLVTEHTAFFKFGTTGDSRLYIGQYQPNQPDTFGIPPTVSLTAPTPNTSTAPGGTVRIAATATDDVAVTSVSFLVNGQVVFTTTVPPYQYNYPVPSGVTSLTITATATDPANNVGTSQAVTVAVLSQDVIAPQVISTVALPAQVNPDPLFFELNGFANSIALANGNAYVASGKAGVNFLSVSDPSKPSFFDAADTPGNANSVKAVGTKLFVADGPAGLQVIDSIQTGGLDAHVIGSLALPGEAWDVAVYDNIAYVADGAAGLQIADVSRFSGGFSYPTLLGSLALPGTAKAVDVNPDRKIAVVAAGSSGVQIIDVSSPASPVLLAGLSLQDLSPGNLNPAPSDTRGVVVRGNYAFIADNAKSFVTIDITDPAHPLQLASTPHTSTGLLQDIAVSGNIAVAADAFFNNTVPIIDVSNPAAPTPFGSVNFSGNYYGTSIATDGRYVYLTGEPHAAGALVENGVSSSPSLPTQVFIGRLRPDQDPDGQPPAVRIAYPPPGATFNEGDTIPIRVAASDDSAVTGVQFFINGQPVNNLGGLGINPSQNLRAFVDSSEPYQMIYTVPAGMFAVSIGATATDLAGNTATAPIINITLTPTSPTTTSATGRVVDSNSQPIPGATVSASGTFTGTYTSTTAADGTFTITNIPALQGNFVVAATVTKNGVVSTASSGQVVPARNSTVSVGDIVVVISTGATQSGGRLFATSGSPGVDNGLFVVDKSSGTASRIGVVPNTPGGLRDLAFNPLDGTLYAVHGTWNGKPPELLTLDPSTAQVLKRVPITTTVTDLPDSNPPGVDGLAFDATGNLWAGAFVTRPLPLVFSNRIIHLNPASGAAITDVMPTGTVLGQGDVFWDLAFDPTVGVMWGAGGYDYPSTLTSVDPVAGAVTGELNLNADPVCSCSPPVVALAVDSYGTKYGFVDVSNPVTYGHGGNQLAVIDWNRSIIRVGSPIAGAQITGLTFEPILPLGAAAVLNISIVSGNYQAAPPYQHLSNPLIVRVTDGSGNPVRVPVHFSVASGFAGVNDTVFTDGQGLAAEPNAVVGGAGQSQILATLPNGYTKTATFTVEALPIRAGVVSGDSQIGVVGQNLPQPLALQLIGSLGLPARVQVTFNDGVTTATAVTDAQGNVAMPWLLSAPAASITVSVGGTVVYTFSATAGNINIMIVSGDGQTGTAGQILPNPLVVQVTDNSGNPIPNLPVTFSDDFNGGTLVAVTDAQGMASVQWKLGAPGDAAGDASVTASILNGTFSVDFAETAMP